MATKGLNLTEISELISIAERYGLEELTVSEGDVAVTIKGAPPSEQATIVAVRPRGKPAASAPVKKEPEGRRIPIVSPMTGVYYRAPSPDAPPFVDIGDHVAMGQTIGLMEAMKVFSEIPSEVEGRVVEVVVGNGVLVQADEPLIMLEPLDGKEE